MSDFSKLLSAWSRRRDACLAMATIVRTSGSTYRRPGARMLIFPGGETLGVLSGGCLESDIAQRAAAVMDLEKPQLVSYDTRVLLGCNGAIDVFIERLSDSATSALFTAAEDHLLTRRSAFVGATLFDAAGDASFRPGSYPIFAADGAELGPAFLPVAARRDAETLVAGDRETDLRFYPSADGETATLLQRFSPPFRLVIFGAGPDAGPLAAFALRLGWKVLAIVHPSQVTQRLPPDCELCVASSEEVAGLLAPDPWTVAVVMTHNYGRDLASLAKLFPLSLPYVGLLGPRNRRERLLADLAEAGVILEGAQVANLYNPAGLDIGADGPDEIAFSIISEIKAVMSGRAGGSLRSRKGAIHVSNAPRIVPRAA
jgi:xanthine/CO dehydrogenase XdhC/CoxF family maturation factor